MTKRRDAFDFSASAADRRRQDRARRSLERERKRRLAAEVKRSKREVLRQRKKQKHLEAKRKKEAQRQQRVEDRRLRAERKRWQKASERQLQPSRARSDRDMQTATRLIDLVGTIVNRVDKQQQAELIAYADEHLESVYEQFTPAEAETVKEQEKPGGLGRALSGLRRVLGLD
jgi:hypothetical protein